MMVVSVVWLFVLGEDGKMGRDLEEKEEEGGETG